jgi:hypothetical protein
MGRARRAAAIAAGAIVLAPAAATAQERPAVPIPEEPTADAPRYIGEPAEPNPVAGGTKAPRHPFMAPNGRSNIHADAYMTDTNTFAGPLGERMRRTSTFQAADCASVTFDRRGRVVSICVGLEGPRLVLLHPRTLDQLASFRLPPRQPGSGTGGGNPFTDFAGGGYFYLDHRDRAVIPTTTRHIYVVRQTSGPGFERARDYDLTGELAREDAIVSALPDYSGLIWFVTTDGVVGHVDPASGEVETRTLRGEGITNSFAVDETGGVYIVTDRALYRFDTVAGDPVHVTWREQYPNSLEQKPGQVDDGSGTTPSVMGDDYVAITDNAGPMNVVVYRRAASVTGEREVCSEPVFEPGASATDNSLIVTDRSIVVENNYGYEGPSSTFQGGVTAPGLARVDLDADGQGCSQVWESEEISPTVVPKLSLANGLVYAYTKTRDSDDPWYLTAIDFRTGDTVYKQLAGFGLGFNNNYAPITLGPDATAYVGVLGGLVALRDTGGDGEPSPPAPEPEPRPSVPPRSPPSEPPAGGADAQPESGGVPAATSDRVTTVGASAGPVRGSALPFTGLPLAIVAGFALSLTAVGLALRRAGR